MIGAPTHYLIEMTTQVKHLQADDQMTQIQPLNDSDMEQKAEAKLNLQAFNRHKALKPDDQALCLKKGFEQSSTFLNDVSVRFDVSSLYKLKSTCITSNFENFCPVQVQINHPTIMQHYGGKYLLRIYDRNGQIIYQRVLKTQMVTQWAVNQDWVFYRPPETEDDANNIFFINCQHGKVFKTSGLNITSNTKHFFKYGVDQANPAYLILANDYEYKLIKGEVFKGENDQTTDISIDSTSIISVTTEYRMWGLARFNKFQNNYEDRPYVIVENKDTHDVDIMKLKFPKDSTVIPFRPSLKLYRQINTDQKQNVKSPVKDVIYTVHADSTDKKIKHLICIVQRQDGKCEIFNNHEKQDDSDANQIIVKISMSLNTTFIKLQSGEVLYLPQNSLLFQSFSQFKTTDQDHMDLAQALKVQSYYRPYQGMYLEFAAVQIAHGPFISSFDNSTNQMVKMIKFNHDIHQLFETVENDDGLKMTFGVLLVNGDIHQHIRLDPQNPKIRFKNLEEPSFQLGAKKILWSYLERKGGDYFFICSEKHDGSRQIHTASHSGIEVYIQGDIIPAQSHMMVILGNQFAEASFAIQNDETDQLILFDQGFKALNRVIDSRYKFTCAVRTKEYFYFFGKRGVMQYNYKDESVHYPVDLNNFAAIHTILVDGNIMYTQTHETDMDSRSALSLLKADDLESQFVMRYSAFGPLGLQEYNFRSERIAILDAFDSLLVIPLLHRAVNSLVGIPRYKTFLATNEFDQYLSVFHKDCFLITFNKINSKQVFRKQYDAAVFGLEGYNLFTYGDTQEYDDEQEVRWQQMGNFKFSILQKVIQEVDPSAQQDDSGNQFVKRTVSQDIYTKHKNVVRQNYLFKVLQIVSPTEAKITREFKFGLVSDDSYSNQNQFYISKDQNRLLEFLESKVVNYYKWVTSPTSQSPAWGEWVIVRTLKEEYDYKYRLQTKFPVLFSPNFKKLINFTRTKNCYQLFDTETGCPLADIPQQIMESNKQAFNVEQVIDEVKQTMKKFSWLDENSFLITDAHGLQRKIIYDGNEFKVDFHMHIPRYYFNGSDRDHMYFNDKTPEKNDIQIRLLDQYKYYKHCKSMTPQFSQFVSKYYNIDYFQGVKDERLRIKLGFTYYHWRLLEAMADGTKDLDQITKNGQDYATLDILVQCIFPQGQTFLTILAKKPEIVRRIMKIYLNDRKNYEIPFLQDIHGKSPLQVYFYKKDYITIDAIMDYLGSRGIDHHSRALETSTPLLIKDRIPTFVKYINTRLVKTHQLEKIKRGAIQDFKQAISAEYLRIDEKEVIKKVAGSNEVLENEIEAYYLDLPKVIDLQDPLSAPFFRELAEQTDFEVFNHKAIRKILDFHFPHIQTFAFWFLIIPYLILMIIWLLYQNIYFDKLRNEDDTQEVDIDHFNRDKAILQAFQGILIAISFYFLTHEAFQMYTHKLHYFTEFWNYMDLMPIVLIIVHCSLDIKQFSEFENKVLPEDQTIPIENIYIVQSITSLLIWIKLLYYLRIFEGTGYLIRMILEVIYDMKYFLTVIFITVLAFGNAFYCLSRANEEPFIDGGFMIAQIYSYDLIMGNWDFEAFGEVGVWLMYVLFLMSTIFNLVIMLNLLIAIISETFARVNDNAQNAAFQEKARMIYELCYLIPKYKKYQYCKPNSYLIFFDKVESAFEEAKENKKEILLKEIVSRLDTLSRQIESRE